MSVLRVQHVKERNHRIHDGAVKLYCGRRETWDKHPEYGRDGLVFANLGNPFKVKNEEDRDQSIASYEKMLDELPDDHVTKRTIRRIAERMNQGRDVSLFCHCAPKACHCDVIAKHVSNQWRERK